MSAVAEQLYDDGVKAVEALGEHFRTLTGIVIPWHPVAADVGLFLESHHRDSFTRSIVKTPNVPLLWSHQRDVFPVGHATNWSIQPHGLVGTFRLNITPLAQQMGQLVRDEDLGGLSIGFAPIRSQWTYNPDWNPDRGHEGLDHVLRLESRLVEVSVVPTPAFADARITSVEAEAVDGSSRSLIAQYRHLVRQYRHTTPATYR